MTHISTFSSLRTIGLDTAKLSFAVHGLDQEGKTVLQKTLRRHQLLDFFAALPPCLVALEACAASHFWAREMTKLGHRVKLIPPQRVKPYVTRMKNDAADARAIAKAALEPELRPVPVKSAEQQQALMLFKARDLLVAQRTQLINALRGHFAETGEVVPQGAQHVQRLTSRINEDGTLPPLMRAALQPLANGLAGLDLEIKRLNAEIARLHRSREISQRLADIPGIGALTATLLCASIPEPQGFRNGREFAAYLGLVPRQHSTGGKPRLGKISKMGNRDLRRLLVVGAVAALARIKHAKPDSAWTRSKLGSWARTLLAKKPFRVVAVALANKMARIAFAVMVKGETYCAIA